MSDKSDDNDIEEEEEEEEVNLTDDVIDDNTVIINNPPSPIEKNESLINDSSVYKSLDTSNINESKSFKSLNMSNRTDIFGRFKKDEDLNTTIEESKLSLLEIENKNIYWDNESHNYFLYKDGGRKIDNILYKEDILKLDYKNKSYKWKDILKTKNIDEEEKKETDENLKYFKLKNIYNNELFKINKYNETFSKDKNLIDNIKESIELNFVIVEQNMYDDFYYCYMLLRHGMDTPTAIKFYRNVYSTVATIQTNNAERYLDLFYPAKMTKENSKKLAIEYVNNKYGNIHDKIIESYKFAFEAIGKK